MNNPTFTFEAKCSSCSEIFEHPSKGDFSYGELILYSKNGKDQLTVSSFEDFPKRVNDLCKAKGVEDYWDVLAMLCDPINGQPITSSIRCSNCGSCDLEYWGDSRLGRKFLGKALFTKASQLSDSEIMDLIIKSKKA